MGLRCQQAIPLHPNPSPASGRGERRESLRDFRVNQDSIMSIETIRFRDIVSVLQKWSDKIEQRDKWKLSLF